MLFIFQPRGGQTLLMSLKRGTGEPSTQTIVQNFLSQGGQPQRPEELSADTNNELLFATYNVENLFDTEDDPGKGDQTYLPWEMKRTKAHQRSCRKLKRKDWQEECLNLDWNHDILEKKMHNLAKVVLSRSPRGPDIMCLQEVENLAILKRWSQVHLKSASYITEILIEGPDVRGIDVALLSRWPLAEKAELIPMQLQSGSRGQNLDSRGILKATLVSPDGEFVTVMCVHLPSPHHPWSLRDEALDRILSVTQEVPKNHLLIVAGDFNVTHEEETRRQSIANHFKSPEWWAAKAHCQSCPGTTYYAPKKTWSFLDGIFVRLPDSEGISSSSRVWRPQSAALLIDGVHSKTPKGGYPRRFEPDTGQGSSDHWPLLIHIKGSRRLKSQSTATEN